MIKLRRTEAAAGLLLEGAKPGIKFALGENPKRSNFNVQGPARYPGSRMGVMDVIRQAFTEARAYRKAWQDYEARKKEKGAVPPGRDLRLDPGKDGDVVVYDRHPLSIQAVAQQVIIEGQVLFDRAEDLADRLGLAAEGDLRGEELGSLVLGPWRPPPQTAPY